MSTAGVSRVVVAEEGSVFRGHFAFPFVFRLAVCFLPWNNAAFALGAGPLPLGQPGVNALGVVGCGHTCTHMRAHTHTHTHIMQYSHFLSHWVYTDHGQLNPTPFPHLSETFFDSFLQHHTCEFNSIWEQLYESAKKFLLATSLEKSICYCAHLCHFITNNINVYKAF